MKLFSDPSDYHKRFDAIVVGTGLTGAWTAKELAEAGLQVLLLEAGPLMHPNSVADTKWWTPRRRSEAARRQATQSRNAVYWHANPELFNDDIDHPYSSDTDFVWIRGRQVGGRSHTWSGLALRFSDHEFVSPEESGDENCWPISYEEIRPYYSKVERFLRVHGSQNHSDALPDGEFALPPDLTETEVRFKKTVESTWQGRRVTHSRSVPAPGAATKTPGWLPKTSLHRILPTAFATGRVTLRPDAIVSHLIFDNETGLAIGAACVDRVTKQTFEVAGRVVCLCASTIESLRIMFNSRHRHHPAGVGNSTGYLGRFLSDQFAVTARGTIPHSSHLPQYPSGLSYGICMPRFRNVQEPTSKFRRGYGIIGAMQRQVPDTARSRNDASWFLMPILEALPHADNRVEPDSSRVDAWGIPTVRVHMPLRGNEQSMKTDALRSVLEMTEAAGLEITGISTTQPGQLGHELGGARMGRGRESSVVGPFNQCWDAQNVYVLDGACFVTAGWQEPKLTMMALAVRACEHIAEALARKSHKD